MSIRKLVGKIRNMKYTELQKKTDADLKKVLVEKRRAIKDFRFGLAGSKIRNVKEGEHQRRDIARILTELRARELAVDSK